MIRVGALRRYPIKSFRGERLDSARLDVGGMHGDRAYGFRDLRTGLVLSGRRTPSMLDGRSWMEGDGTLASFGDVEGVDPFDPRLSAAVTDAVGAEVEMVRADEFDEALPMEGTQGAFTGAVGRLVDLAPIHIVTTASLRALSAMTPGSSFDARRFRPNILLEVEEVSPVERDWVGGEIAIGEVVLNVTKGCGRCAMTNRAQDELPHDSDVLRTVAQVENVVGVYAEVSRGGTINEGDLVQIG